MTWASGSVAAAGALLDMFRASKTPNGATDYILVVEADTPAAGLPFGEGTDRRDRDRRYSGPSPRSRLHMTPTRPAASIPPRQRVFFMDVSVPVLCQSVSPGGSQIRFHLSTFVFAQRPVLNSPRRKIYTRRGATVEPSKWRAERVGSELGVRSESSSSPQRLRVRPPWSSTVDPRVSSYV